MIVGAAPDSSPRTLCATESRLLLSLVSHSRTESWCLRRRVKPDLLVLLAQSHASRGLAPDALSAQLAAMTFSSNRRSHLLREALRPMLSAHSLTPLVGAISSFARPCARCVVCPLTNSTSWRFQLLREASRPMLCPPNSLSSPSRQVGAVTCFARPCTRCFCLPNSRSLFLTSGGGGVQCHRNTLFLMCPKPHARN